MAENTDIKTVMVIMEMTVDTAMAEDKIFVSSPIFSAWIMGRFPTGTAAMRHMARVATGSKDSACITKTIAIGSKTIRSAT